MKVLRKYGVYKHTIFQLLKKNHVVLSRWSFGSGLVWSIELC